VILSIKIYTMIIKHAAYNETTTIEFWEKQEADSYIEEHEGFFYKTVEESQIEDLSIPEEDA
jgi:hypothetical protein